MACHLFCAKPLIKWMLLSDCLSETCLKKHIEDNCVVLNTRICSQKKSSDTGSNNKYLFQLKSISCCMTFFFTSWCWEYIVHLTTTNIFFQRTVFDTVFNGKYYIQRKAFGLHLMTDIFFNKIGFRLSPCTKCRAYPDTKVVNAATALLNVIYVLMAVILVQ